MKIAILGAGYSGLSVAYYLLQVNKNSQITLYDPEPLGNNASGVSTGLMHPYLGAWAKRSWRSEEGIEETVKLLQCAERALGTKIYSAKGVFRPALDERQKKTFKNLCEQNEDAVWWEEEEVFSHFSSFLAPKTCGMYVKSGVSVDSMLYLKGLWTYLQEKGVKWVSERVFSLRALDHFDKIIVCAGEQSFQFFSEWEHEVQKRKGHAIIGNWPFSEKLFCPIIGKGHISLNEAGLSFIGSTYEREFADKNPEPKKVEELLHKVGQFFPKIDQIKILETKANVRLARTDSYLPYLKRVDTKTVLFTAFGSRGLLYHAIFAKLIAESIFKENLLAVS